MSIALNSALNAYKNAANVSNNAGGISSGNNESGMSNVFSGLVEKPIEKSVSSIRTAESVAMGNLAKQSDLTDVIAAVTKAETTLKTVVAVRDKLVNAFQELSKMPI